MSQDPPLSARPAAQMPAIDRRILEAVRRIVRSIELYSRRLASGHGVTVPQVLCMAALAEADEPMTVSELSKAVRMSASTVVGVLDRLAAKFLITRERDTRDRRRVLVSITDAGREVLGATPSLLQDRLSAGLRDLNDDERRSIAEALESVVALMDTKGVSAAPVLEAGPLVREGLAPLPEPPPDA